MDEWKSEPAAKVGLLKLLEARRRLDGATIISELVVGRQSNRADLVIASDRLACFEIKTCNDTLGRLKPQLASYVRCFDETTVVCATKHLEGALRQAPLYVGVIEMREARSDLKFVMKRAARRSTEVQVEGLLDLLPVENIRRLLDGEKLPRKRSDMIALAASLPFRTVHSAVMTFLHTRYRQSTAAFRAARGHKSSDIALLQRLPRRAPSPSSAMYVRDGDERELFGFVGRSFGSVPAEIARAFMAA